VSLATSAHQAFAERVEERLEQAVATDPGAVARAGAQTLRSGGKRLRPLLVSMCATDAARGGDDLVRSGCAVELVHMATLVHDDVLDAAPLRRGHPTVWRTDGRGLATATGDHLFARAFAELTATGDMPAVAILADACLGLARGEILQRHQAGDPSVTVDGYLERCTLKTGRLFSAAARLGARFSQLSADDAAALGRFAEALGLAFQIADDVLDCDGDPDTTGKPLGTDLLDGTVTLPLLLAAQRDEHVAAALLDRERAQADVVGVLARVARTGAIADTRRALQEHADAARATLDALPDRSDRRALEAIVQAATTRDH
jgi:geranylgeranyl pyrophosphate synthase